MGQAAVGQRDPEAIRRDIDSTRAELSSTIDQIEDRVSPSRMASRSGQRMRSRWQRTREAVMGSAQEGRQRMSQTTEAGGQRLDQAEEAVERNVRGNPLAAGLIAFGAGALAASLLPSSRSEQRLAHSVREQAEPVVPKLRGELQSTGREVGQQLSEEARQAAQETAESAKWAAQSTADNAKEAAQATGEHAKEAAQSTGEQAKGAAQQTKQAGQGGGG